MKTKQKADRQRDKATEKEIGIQIIQIIEKEIRDRETKRQSILI